MNLKALALAAVAATGIGFAAPAEARNIPLHMYDHCVVGDPTDTSANFRMRPNGQYNMTKANGTHLGKPFAEENGWTLFRPYGWIQNGRFSCEVMS